MKITVDDLDKNHALCSVWQKAKIYLNGEKIIDAFSIDTDIGEIGVFERSADGSILIDKIKGEVKTKIIKGKIRIEFEDGEIIES